MKKPKHQSATTERFLDQETLALLRGRNREFLAKLFLDVNPYLSRICFANGLYDTDAEEVIFATWDRFFVNIEKFQGQSQIRTFICGILFNKIREYRRAAGRTSYEENSESFMNSAFTAEGWWKADPGDPHKLLELRSAGNLIKDCLDGLTDQQKAAFVMKEVEEEDSQDICNAMGVNVSHLRVLLFRAKDKLRKCLEGKADLGGA